ncbi:WYL domain-containing protein [Bradyrhizobium sp. CSA207]|uniref:WYL domain-containing protein n=1 Tax=Bradyrhizobium sp. CSA207 TaxID=2698826 RepID=UPI0023B01489|nr:WYL domain-containing protein [Bradyrhizobium sp. CSA207]MDE5442524.1 WYL domain-containing protein [Bradyrhizobium sp. CSA207]
MTQPTEIKWGLAQRFEFIEWRAYWDGRINRRDLELEFDISTPQASIDLREYQKTVPRNIEYSATEKTYVATQDFRPKFLNLSPERYLLQLRALTSSSIRQSDTWFDRVPPVDVVPDIVRGPQAYTLRAVVRAISAGSAVSINYQSLTRTGVRTILPHALGHDGYRWHVRALSLDRVEFRDYVLGRILSIGSAPTHTSIDPADDVEWQTKFSLRLIAYPELDDRQKETIEREYRFKDGELAIDMRLALAFYFIKRNNLDLRKGEIPPARAQLFLQNYEEFLHASQQAKEESKRRLAAGKYSPANQ